MTQTLDEYLDEAAIDGIESVPADPETDEPARWKLTSLDAADWAFRKLKREKERRAEIMEQARVQRERIDAWVEDACTPVDHSIEYFEGLLKEWAASEVLTEFAERQDWSKVRKTLSTPNGKVAARRSTDGTFTTSDEARENAIRILKEVDRRDLIAVTERVGSSLFDEGRKRGDVRLNDRHEYEVVAGTLGEWIVLPGIRRDGVGQITFKVETA